MAIYFVPKLFPEIISKGLYVLNAKGNMPYEDAVLDFSNLEPKGTRTIGYFVENGSWCY
jgi:hypothetical protein